MSIQLASIVVKPENFASCLSSGLSLRQPGCHSRSRSCSTATSLPTLSANEDDDQSPVVSSWRTAPPTSWSFSRLLVALTTVLAGQSVAAKYLESRGALSVMCVLLPLLSIDCFAISSASPC